MGKARPSLPAQNMAKTGRNNRIRQRHSLTRTQQEREREERKKERVRGRERVKSNTAPKAS